MSISSGALLFATAFLLKETYAPVLLRRRQHKRRAYSGSPGFEKSAADRTGVGLDEKQADTPDSAMLFGHAITRPLRFLATSPILVIFGFFFAVREHRQTIR
jgi:DHA1 family multidrug resistance protein-like MFS transporter